MKKKTFIRVRILLVALLSALLFLLRVPTWAEEHDVVKTDYIYTDLPEVQVYFHILDQNGNAITAITDKDSVLLQCDEEWVQIKSVDLANSEKTQVYCLIDVSDSMPSKLFDAIKAEILDLYRTQSENIRITLITFGREVNVCLNGDESLDVIEKTIADLHNNEDKTVLYDAISKIGELAASRTTYTRREAFLFTDGEDWSVGGHTQEETVARVKECGIPLYAFGASTAQKKHLDSLSVLSRASGGTFYSVSADNIADRIKHAMDYADSGFVARAELKSNAVGSQTKTVVLQVGNSSDIKDIRIVNWQEDNTAPIITNIAVDNETLVLSFSENTLGGNEPSDYTIAAGKKQYAIEGVKRISDKEVEIYIGATLYDGEYEITAAHITDASVEKNPLTDTYVLTIEDNPYTISAFLFDYWVIIVVAALACITIAALIVALKKKRKKTNDKLNSSPAVVRAKNSEKYHIEAIDGKDIHLSISRRNMPRRDISLFIPSSPPVEIGRSEACDVIIDDEQISRKNTELSYRNGKIYVKNISKTNGTMLNGLMIEGERELHSGDTILIGDTRVSVLFS